MESLSDFEVKRSLGAGASGRVIAAVNRHDGRTYAIKQVPITDATSCKLNALLNEVRLLASVRDAHVLEYYASFVHEEEIIVRSKGKNTKPTSSKSSEISKTLCMVFELAAGSLEDVWTELLSRKQRLDEACVWRVLAHTLRGLRALHQHNIAHRDLKPANILFSVSDDADESADLQAVTFKLADLGTATRRRDINSRTRRLVGTPYFIAPEIWRHEPPTLASDIWSLGVMAWQLVFCRMPFDLRSADRAKCRSRRERIYAVGELIRDESYHLRMPSEVARNVSEPLKQLLTTCLQRDKTKRPTVDELLRTPEIARINQVVVEGTPRFVLGGTFPFAVTLEQLLTRRRGVAKQPSAADPSASSLLQVPVPNNFGQQRSRLIGSIVVNSVRDLHDLELPQRLPRSLATLNAHIIEEEDEAQENDTYDCSEPESSQHSRKHCSDKSTFQTSQQRTPASDSSTKQSGSDKKRSSSRRQLAARRRFYSPDATPATSQLNTNDRDNVGIPVGNCNVQTHRRRSPFLLVRIWRKLKGNVSS
ncbi:MAG: hypothetical protein MHM6MM_000413 [Cercozoa sp. M6MM]